MIPWPIALIVLATDLSIVMALLRLVTIAGERSGVAPAAQQRVRIGAGVFLAAWLGGDLLLAPAPAALAGGDPFAITPLIPLFFAVPSILVAVALWRSSTLRQVLAAAPTPLVHGLQLYRLIGAVFLVLLAQGRVPAHFALPAGWGDVTVGLSAPLVALALARKARGSRALAIAWNVFGLLDLFVAVGMGTGALAPLLVPRLGPRVPAVAAMGAFPMILVPTFAVPVSVMLHLWALRGLRREVRLYPHASQLQLAASRQA